MDDQAIDLDPLTAQIEQYQLQLERALCARFGNDDGLDAASEAIAYGIEHWDRVSSMANPAGYLYRVGQTVGNRLRDQWARVDVLVEEPRTTDTVVDIDLQRALMRLDPDQRVCIVLVHAHGYTYADAARTLDIPETTLANHLHRARVRLRRIMGDQ